MRQLDCIRTQIISFEEERELGDTHRALLLSGGSFSELQAKLCAPLVERKVASRPPDLLAKID